MAAEFLERMGARLRERRDELGLSRAEVARRMPGKVNENQVYRWENGKHQPNPDTLEALANILERDVSYFMTPAVETPPADDTEPPDVVELAKRLDGIEGLLTNLTERLVAAQVIAAVDEDSQPRPQPAPAKHRRRAA